MLYTCYYTVRALAHDIFAQTVIRRQTAFPVTVNLIERFPPNALSRQGCYVLKLCLAHLLLTNS